jgi:16S rRNA (cytidine1402-2'-O)-methyltransferase
VIVLAATPIGNLGDATKRLIDALSTVTVIAAEDTRVTQRLLAGLGISHRPRLVSLNDHNERERIGEVLALAADTDVLVLSDAGMPTVSDPGYRLVTAAVEAGIQVTVLPGASAVPTALAVSGLPTDRFAFEGFPPRKPAERRALLRDLAREPRTLVFFESPQRVADFLADLSAEFGADRRVAVCRELTKLHEEVVRGRVEDVARWATEGVRGEIVVVVEGAAPVTVSAAEALEQVQALVAAGSRLRDASAEVADATGLSRRELYEAALRGRS